MLHLLNKDNEGKLIFDTHDYINFFIYKRYLDDSWGNFYVQPREIKFFAKRFGLDIESTNISKIAKDFVALALRKYGEMKCTKPMHIPYVGKFKVYLKAPLIGKPRVIYNEDGEVAIVTDDFIEQFTAIQVGSLLSVPPTNKVIPFLMRPNKRKIFRIVIKPYSKGGYDKNLLDYKPHTKKFIKT